MRDALLARARAARAGPGCGACCGARPGSRRRSRSPAFVQWYWKPSARQEAGGLERRALVVAAEVHVHARELVRDGRARASASRERAQEPARAVRAGRGQEARAGHGRERHADQQLRVVVDARRAARRPPSPSRRRTRPRCCPSRRAGRPPRGARPRAATSGRGSQPVSAPTQRRLLERREPLPFEERRLVARRARSTRRAASARHAVQRARAPPPAQSSRVPLRGGARARAILPAMPEPGTPDQPSRERRRGRRGETQVLERAMPT